MTTLEKIEKLDSLLHQVRSEVAGLGLMSVLLRDIKNDVIQKDKKIASLEDSVSFVVSNSSLDGNVNIFSHWKEDNPANDYDGPLIGGFKD